MKDLENDSQYAKNFENSSISSQNKNTLKSEIFFE